MRQHEPEDETNSCHHANDNKRIWNGNLKGIASDTNNMPNARKNIQKYIKESNQLKHIKDGDSLKLAIKWIKTRYTNS